MLAISKFARWLKDPSGDVAVVIVSSAALAEDVSHGLEAAIADWNEVAHLRVEDMEGLQANWLATDVAHAAGECQASEMLRAVSKRCYLLDLESDGPVRLAWLGSVCGHELRCLQLEPALSAQAQAQIQAQEQVAQVMEVARSLVKTILEERFAP